VQLGEERGEPEELHQSVGNLSLARLVEARLS
jgi:hypothetical protein